MTRHRVPLPTAIRAFALPLALLLGAGGPVPLAAQRPAALAVPVVQATPALLRRLQEQAARTGGVVGLHAVHLETGRQVSLRADERFLMASVTKLPLAVRVLREVDRGTLRLADTVDIPVSAMAPGRSPIRERHPHGARLTVEELVRAAVSDSDNTANDVLQRLAGGPERIGADLAAAGIRGIRVDRPYLRLSREVVAADTADPRDTATPRAATSLLAALRRGRLLSPSGTGRLLDWLTRTANPADRIVAGVPAGTPVAHKTGTWGSEATGGMVAINDVGLITLPQGRGHLAVAIFVRSPSRPAPEVSAAMAAMTRTLFDHWTRGAAR
jgi:beta-lactamase class A